MFKLTNFSLIFVLLIFLAISSFAQTRQRPRRATTATTTPVSDTDISGGLREALLKGVSNAIKSLGRENGFLSNLRVKIPVPGSLKTVAKGLRAAGQGQKVDDFVAAMNHAAEKAVPVAFDIFVDSIKQMTFEDARSILFSGQDDAATQYFRRTTEETLRGKFRPIVEKFTAETGVTAQYKNLMGKAGFLSALGGKDATDIDGYVTQKALDGLFLLVADEEKNIRKNPLGRTTDLLRKVFGGVFK
jgi:Protein of unknown function (DUF4197)